MDLVQAAAKAAAAAGIEGMPTAEETAGMDPEVLSQQATQIWSMLDDLSKRDPKVRCGHTFLPSFTA